MSFNASKTPFLHLSTRHYLPDTYPLFFNNTRLSPSSTLNILGLSLSNDLNWKFHISSLTKSASAKLGVLYRLRRYFSLSQMLTIYKGPVCPCMEYASHVWRSSTHSSFKQSRIKSFLCHRLSSSHWLFFHLISAAMLLHFLYFTVIFMLTALLNVLTACLHLSHGLAAQDFPLKLTLLLSKFLIQELTCIFSLSSLLLVNSGTAFLCLHFLLPTTWVFFQKWSVKAFLDSELICFLPLFELSFFQWSSN